MKESDRVIRRALISVSDKSGIEHFARALAEMGIQLISTGGTFRALKAAGLSVTEVSEYTGFPEIMGGRVKTLHPRIHGGILARRGVDDAVMQENSLLPIDLVVVNLYPFTATVARPDCDFATGIENIDIGGPCMVRAAAKNHQDVTVVVDPEDYSLVRVQLEQGAGCISESTRLQLACKAFQHTADYDAAVATWLGRQQALEQAPDTAVSPFAQEFFLHLSKVEDLRYGENPHQKAAFYREPEQAEASVAHSRQLQGKALSFNNIADTDAALECVKPLADPACVIVKHANPCGVALGADLQQAYDLAYATDPVSAFGGVIAFNRNLDAVTAKALVERQFVEVVIAPEISPEALTVFAAKPNVRVLACGALGPERHIQLDLRRVTGGLLVQDRDLGMIDPENLAMVTQRSPTEEELSDLLFAWEVAKFVKSNAIVYARNGRTIGVGAGQMSRIYSARIAAIKAQDAGLEVAGSVMASDAFFPFRDSVDAAAQAGITAIIQPGGSMRDQESIDAANENGLAMVFTGMRHFRH